MTTRETRVPSIPAIAEDNTLAALNAIKSGLDVREGRTGDPLDQFVTLRDMMALGLVMESKKGTDTTGVGGGGGVLPVTGTGGFGPDDYDEQGDLTTPPAPTDLTATGAYSSIILSWGGNGYKNHAYTEIWRNTTDSLGSAVKVGSTIGNLYNDEVGTEKTFYYWVRFVSRANVTGPYNLTSGTGASTALDVVKRLEVLREEILNDQLTVDLGSRLNIVETGISRVEQITATQAAAISQVSSVSGSNKAAVQVVAKSVDGLQAQYTVKIDNNGHVSGFGLASSTVNGTPRSAFIVRADRFAIVGPTDARDPLGTLSPTNVPFTVLTTPTTIDGLTYPAGAWIKTAFIADATITNAKIQSLSADKITAGTITAAVDMRTPTIRSGNINPGTAGFYLGQFGGVNRFYIGNGSTGTNGRSLEFDGTNAIVRGTIFAYAGEITNLTARSLTIYDQNNNVILSSSGINNSLISIANSQVSGLGTLATQNSVTTNQVTGLGALATQNNVFVGSTVRFGDGTVMNTGDFVNRLSQITSSNVSTFIASAAIGDAYIGNLSAAKITTGTLSADRISANSITADKINTNGLEIRDSKGNIVLSSGSTLTGNQPVNAVPTFSAIRRWNFDNQTVVAGAVDGWTATGATLTVNTSSLIFDSTGTSPSLFSPEVLNIEGRMYDKVQMRIRRTAGTGWSGGLYFKALSGVYISRPLTARVPANTTITVNGVNYTTSVDTSAGCSFLPLLSYPTNVHAPIGSAVSGAGVPSGTTVTSNSAGQYSFATSAYKIIATDPTLLNNWVTIEWDMSVQPTSPVQTSLWRESFVFSLEFDLGSTSADLFEIDWITVGRYVSGGVDRITPENATTFIADLAVNTLQIAGNAITIPLTNAVATLISHPGTGNLTTMTYSFTQPFGGKVILVWTSKAFSVRDANFKILLNSVEVGSTRVGTTFQDQPIAVGFGDAIAGSNSVQVIFETYSSGRDISDQKLIVLGAQR